MADPRLALRGSTDQLRDLAGRLADRLDGAAYPKEWSVADVVSHLGSGAVLFSRWLDDALAGHATSRDLAADVWAEWGAKSSADKVHDGLQADEAFTSRLERMRPDEAASVHLQLSSMQLDFDGVVRVRLAEHALHTWDLDVVLDPRAELPAPCAEALVDHLAHVAGASGRPGPVRRDVAVRTTTPTRHLVVRLGRTRVELDANAPATERPFDVQLPAEAFIRLVYGRLDPSHTPHEVLGDPDVLDELRWAFPGV